MIIFTRIIATIFFVCTVVNLVCIHHNAKMIKMLDKLIEEYEKELEIILGGETDR